MIGRITMGFIFLLFYFQVTAQSDAWWATTVNWDGVSHWSRYMITQPAYQGPNALPVPKIGNGSLDTSLFLSASGNFHFSKGDQTQNIILAGNYCIVKDRVSVDVSWVPYERYRMDHDTKTERHVFHHFYYDNRASGELHVNTNFQIMNKWRKDIHLVLRAGYRFPCGSGFGTARYTDAPGYYFDLSFGKPFRGTAVKWIGMLGFYSWQMVSDKHRQNDAILFGTGLEWNPRSFSLQTYVGGYVGYMEDSGDKPVVFRLNTEKKFGNTGLILRFQQGLNDFKYSSAEAGIKFYFPTKLKDVSPAS
jgi:hypothetical protein